MTHILTCHGTRRREGEYFHSEEVRLKTQEASKHLGSPGFATLLEVRLAGGGMQQPGWPTGASSTGFMYKLKPAQ